MGVVQRAGRYLWLMQFHNHWSQAWDSTDVTNDLNSRIAPSADHTHPYTGGKGVLVRDLIDTLQNDASKFVVPATFWSNDIYAVSQMYPDVDTQDQGTDDVWKFASVGIVIGKNMPDMYYDYDNIQQDSWGWGVFYARDSNSVDVRCRWLQTFWGYDCPGGWIDGHTGKWSDDSSKRGAGGYPAGNPIAAPKGQVWGGGAGCHLARDTHTMDQVNAVTGDSQNLVQNRDCECNYAFESNWGDWVDDWVSNADKTNLSPYSFWGDRTICWVNDLRQMINMQNWLYWKWVAKEWSEKLGWPGKGSEREYVGWNEIPVDRNSVGNSQHWDAFLIKLPANVCGHDNYDRNDVPQCLDQTAQKRLEDRIDEYVKAGYIKPGVQNVGVRPGSYTVFAQQYKTTGPNWQTVFFCQPWQGPTGRWKVVSVPISDSNPTGACYMEQADKSNQALIV